jgi:hypothetical protein
MIFIQYLIRRLWGSSARVNSSQNFNQKSLHKVDKSSFILPHHMYNGTINFQSFLSIKVLSKSLKSGRKIMSFFTFLFSSLKNDKFFLNSLFKWFFPNK